MSDTELKKEIAEAIIDRLSDEDNPVFYSDNDTEELYEAIIEVLNKKLI